LSGGGPDGHAVGFESAQADGTLDARRREASLPHLRAPYARRRQRRDSEATMIKQQLSGRSPTSKLIGHEVALRVVFDF
jgi:hypothetical protein